jgi:hypothetical protein
LYPKCSGVLAHLSTGLAHLFYDVLRYCTLERKLRTISTVPGRSCSNLNNSCILNHGILQAEMSKGRYEFDVNRYGFIDGTLGLICHPQYNQKAAYSGHRRFHGIKFQLAYLPEGLYIHFFGPIAGSRHYSHMLKGQILLVINSFRCFLRVNSRFMVSLPICKAIGYLEDITIHAQGQLNRLLMPICLVFETQVNGDSKRFRVSLSILN